MFQGPMAAQARQMLNDPNFRRMMTDPEMMRNMSNMRRTMPGLFGGMRGMGGQPGEGNQAFPMPGNAEGGETAADTQRNPETQEGQTNTSQPPYNSFSPFDNAGAGGAAGNPFTALFGNMAPTRPGNDGTPGTNSTQQQQGQPTETNPFQAINQMFQQNPQLMGQLMQTMGASNLPGDPASNSQQPQNQNPFAALGAMGGFNPGAFGGFGAGNPPSQPPDNRPPEDRYAEQLRQLNDMGFYEFERNVEALRRTGGSVQGAVEYLLTH